MPIPVRYIMIPAAGRLSDRSYVFRGRDAARNNSLLGHRRPGRSRSGLLTGACAARLGDSHAALMPARLGGSQGKPQAQE